MNEQERWHSKSMSLRYFKGKKNADMMISGLVYWNSATSLFFLVNGNKG